MTISSIYKKYLTELIIKDSLKQGIVLSDKEILEKLDNIISINQNLDQPFLSKDVYEVKEEEKISSSKTNLIFNTIYNDLSIAYQALDLQAKDITSIYDSVVAEFKAIEKRIKILEEKTDNLLLTSSNTEGYLSYFSEIFNNKEHIDTVLSDVFIDNKTGIVTLPLVQQKRLDIKVIENDLQFNVVTRENLILTKSFNKCSPQNAFTDDENIWLQSVETSRSSGVMIADLIIRMENISAEISKIIFRPAASDAGNVSTITLQYSDDGLNWYNVEGEKTKPLHGDVSFVFSPVTAKYWKFVFTKASYDDHRGKSFFYEFGAKAIQFYGISYKQKENKANGVLYSSIWESEDLFSKASLSVCDSVPAKTKINYSIAGLTEQDILDIKNNIIQIPNLTYYNIDPIEKESPIHPVLINFNKDNALNGISSEYIKDNSINFSFKNNYNISLNYVIPSNVIQNDIKILRNTGDNTIGQSYLPYLVKDVAMGWEFDGTYYSCNFYVTQESGKIIDFGNKNLEIDGYIINGKITIKKGFHTAKIHKDNWRIIHLSTATFTENPDTLYPYNHKYLIEGIADSLYGMDLTEEVNGITKKDIIDPDGVYTGVKKYWGKTLEKISDFDFSNNVKNDNFNIYCITKDYNGDERIIVKDSEEPGLLIYEKLAIITRVVSSDLYKGIVLKAELKSDDPKITPVLDQYIVKLGT